MADVKGRTVVITGGAHNLGGAVARRIGADGASIAVHYNSASAADDADATVAAVVNAGGQAFAHQADLSVPAQVDALFDAATDRYGPLYATVNTVGNAKGSPVAETPDDDLEAMVGANVRATFYVLRAAARRTEHGGRIVNLVTSLLAAYTPGYALYAGTKATNEHFIRALSKELADNEISVNNVAPGPMDTAFYWDAAHEGETEMVSGMAMGNRLTRVDDIVPWIHLLLTDGGWASGQTFFINGGFATR